MSLGTIDSSGPIERALARLLLTAYERRLRVTVEAAPAWMSEETLGASELWLVTEMQKPTALPSLP